RCERRRPHHRGRPRRPGSAGALMRCRRMLMRAMIGTGFGLLTATALHAQDKAPPLAEIEVTGERITEAERRAPTAFITDVDVTAREQALDTAVDVLAES